MSAAPLRARPKVLLVHPQGQNWVAGERDITRIANVMPPHGLMMLASYLERRGHDADILDCFAWPMSHAEVVRAVLVKRPDLVGFTSTTSSFLGACAIAAAIKEAAPQVRVLFGGVHATSLWKALLEKYQAIDFIAVGEGEATLLDLLEAGLEPGAGIPGLAWREPSGEVRFGGERPLLPDLDVLPLPAYDKLAGFPGAYPLPLFNYPRSPATTLITSRGCPYSCSYCDRSVFRSTFRYHSAEYLAEHLRYLKRRYGIRHVSIYDDNFTLKRGRVLDLMEHVLRQKLGISFNCIGRANHLDRELLRSMKRAGCWMVNLGVESGDQALIARHRSQCDLQQMAETVRTVRDEGIRVKGLFMMGIPGETEESLSRTVRYAAEHPFDDVNCTKFTPFPGSPGYAGIRELGQFQEDWDLMNCLNFVFVPHGLTRERLEHWYARFFKSYYNRPRTLWRYTAMLWKSPESWRRFLRNLPDFLAVKRQIDARVGAPG